MPKRAAGVGSGAKAAIVLFAVAAGYIVVFHPTLPTLNLPAFHISTQQPIPIVTQPTQNQTQNLNCITGYVQVGNQCINVFAGGGSSGGGGGGGGIPSYSLSLVTTINGTDCCIYEGAYDQSKKLFYGLADTDNKLDIVNLNTNTIVDRIDLVNGTNNGFGSSGYFNGIDISITHEFVYVGNYDNQYVLGIPLASDGLSEDLGQSREIFQFNLAPVCCGISYDSTNNYLRINAQNLTDSTTDLLVVNAANGNVVQDIVGIDSGADVVTDQVAGKYYYGNGTTALIVSNLADSVQNTIPISGIGDFGVDFGTNRVLVINGTSFDNGTAMIVNAQTGAISMKENVLAGYSQLPICDSVLHVCYFIDHAHSGGSIEPDNLYAIDMVNGVISDTLPTMSRNSLAVDTANHHIVTTNYSNKNIKIYVLNQN